MQRATIEMATTGGQECHGCSNRISYGKELALVQVSPKHSEPYCMVCFLRLILKAGEVLILSG